MSLFIIHEMGMVIYITNLQNRKNAPIMCSIPCDSCTIGQSISSGCLTILYPLIQYVQGWEGYFKMYFTTDYKILALKSNQ